MIRVGQQPAELAARSSQEVINAIGAISGKKHAVAARRLRSGDTVITVARNKGALLEDQG